MEQPERFFVTEILSGIFRHASAIVVITVVAVLSAGVFDAFTTTNYTAVTRILVGIGREKMQDLGMETHPVGNLVFQERAQNVNNEVEILRDPALITRSFAAMKARLDVSEAKAPPPVSGLRVIIHGLHDGAKAVKGWIVALPKAGTRLMVALGLRDAADPDTALAIEFYKALSIIAVKETDVISVSFTWADPVFAAEALNIYLAQYQAQHLRVYESKLSVSFFQTQLTKAQDELHDVDGQREAFMREGGLSDFETEKAQLLGKIGTLQQEASAARIDGRAMQERLLVSGRTDGAGSSVAAGSEVESSVHALDQTYQSLMTQRALLLTRFQPDAQPVREVDSQLAELRSQKTKITDVTAKAQAAALESRIAGLDQDIATKQAALAALTERNSQFDSLQRRRTAATELVNEYRRKLEDLEVNSAMNSSAFSSVRILSEAVPPVLPSFSVAGLIFKLAAVFGLLAGIAYALIVEHFSRTFRQPSQVKRVLGLPVLACVPEIV